MNKHLRLIKIYKRLLENYGEQNWWPADSKLECAIGAILTQNTSWNNVEKAIINIKSVMDITIENLSVLSTNELSLLIRPSGFYKQKAKRIKRLIVGSSPGCQDRSSTSRHFRPHGAPINSGG